MRRRWVVVCRDEAARQTFDEAVLRADAVTVLDRTGARAMLIEADDAAIADLGRAFPGVLIVPEKAGYRPG